MSELPWFLLTKQMTKRITLKEKRSGKFSFTTWSELIWDWVNLKMLVTHTEAWNTFTVLADLQFQNVRPNNETLADAIVSVG